MQKDVGIQNERLGANWGRRSSVTGGRFTLLGCRSRPCGLSESEVVVADQGGGVAGWVVVAVHGCALLVWGYSEVRH